MMSIIQCGLLIAVLGLLPLCIGEGVSRVSGCHRELNIAGMLFRILFGNLLMWAVFECITIPMVLSQCPFDWGVWLWGIMIGCILFFTIRMRRPASENASKQPGEKKWTAFDVCMAVLVIGLVFLQIYMYVAYMHLDEDDVYYLGTSINALEYNTMYMSNYETGAVLPGMEMRLGDPVCAWLYYFALLSKLTLVSPTMIAHTFLPIVLVVMMYAAYWLIVDLAFESNAQACLISVFFVALINMYFSGSAYTQSVFSLTRIWQGKAVVASVIMPAFMYLVLLIYQSGDNKGVFLLFSVLNTAACSLSGMGVLLIGILDAVYGAYLVTIQRRKKMVYAYALAVMPTAILGGIFIFLTALYIRGVYLVTF